MRYVILMAGALLVASGLGACTSADREAMFSSDRAPKVGRCDPQPGYGDPRQKPGCEYAPLGTGK